MYQKRGVILILVSSNAVQVNITFIEVSLYCRKELGKSVNADEAAALGAVYQAAAHSKMFRVKKFGIRDGNLYPIQVENKILVI